jgi:ankyrin repeat protein
LSFLKHLTRFLQREATSRIAKKGTGVHRACSHGDVELVEDYMIVDRSCLKQTQSYFGDEGTPFYHACSAGHLPVVEAILAFKADVNDTDVIGDALAGASRHGHLAVVEALLALGINVNSR